jgi:hypothetical protein
MKPLTHKEALEAIANHFELSNLEEDHSDMIVVQIACRALGWTINRNNYGEIYYTHMDVF